MAADDNAMPVTVRAAVSADLEAIRAVHRAAFPTDDESRLAALIVERRNDRISLLATLDERPVGHVLFSPATVEWDGGEPTSLSALGLGPMAVVPEFQRQGIGSELIRRGLADCRIADCELVVVFGSAEFYGRFGFVPARRFGLRSEYGGGDHFQVQWLSKPPSSSGGGLVRYCREFTELFPPDPSLVG